MTGSTIEVAHCPNIPPGWPCPWARRWAASGRARCRARLYRAGGGGASRGGVCFTAFFSNGACPTVLCALSSVYKSLFSVLAGRVLNGRGFGAKDPSYLRHYTRLESPVGP